MVDSGWLLSRRRVSADVGFQGRLASPIVGFRSVDSPTRHPAEVIFMVSYSGALLENLCLVELDLCRKLILIS
jgi:hypothetical protein